MKKRILSALLALSMALTLLPGAAFAAEGDTAPEKPTVSQNDLWQVDIVCEHHLTDKANYGSHFWNSSYPNNTGTEYFAVGDPVPNTDYQPETYPWKCPVMPKEGLSLYLGLLNEKAPGHRLLTETLPVAYYYWNGSAWTFIKDKAANPNCMVDGNNGYSFRLMATCSEEQGGDPEEGKPATKPAVKESDLYQVEIVCEHKDEHIDDWWSAVGEVEWARWINDFKVGEIEKNTAYQSETYPWRCPVTPKEDLEFYLGKLNAKQGVETHKLIDTKLPVAYYYWDGSAWTFIKDEAANPNCTVSTDGKNTWYLSIRATCEGVEEPDPGPSASPDPGPEGPIGELTWLTSMNIQGYDMFTKEPADMPDTADGRFLLLAQSGAEGDDAVYALYLNPASCQPNNGVVAGQGVTAVRLGMDQDGRLAGCVVGSDEKIPVSDLLLTAEATEGGYTLSNGGKYLNFSGGTMVGSAPGPLEISSRAGAVGTYRITMGKRCLTLYIAEQHHYNATWQTNFWTPQADQGQVGAFGSSYVYFLHAHVEDGKSVQAFGPEGAEIQAVDGSFTIPAGGSVVVEGQTTFTVPKCVASVTVPVNYASGLVLDANGGFGMLSTVITMENGDQVSSVLRSGQVDGLYYARTSANAVYISGEGDMPNYSAKNTAAAPWLTGVGDRTIRSAYIGAGITSVGSNAFKATSLSSVEFAQDGALSSIGSGAFEGCRIEGLALPASVEFIGENAFRGCTGLRSVTLAGDVASVGASAFANCPRLRSVTFEGSVGSLSSSAFQAISAHAPLTAVFEAGLPASAYAGDYEGMLPFLHQNGALLYADGKPSEALVKAAGNGDAYFADLNGGALSAPPRPGVLPELGAKAGRAFRGWRVGDTNAALPAGTAVSGQPAGTVFTAAWEGDGEFTVACTVVIDGKGYAMAAGETLGGRMPQPEQRDGYIFLGWFDASGNAFTADTVVNGNMTVTSKWEKIPTYFVTFDPNGGVIYGKTRVEVLQGGTVAPQAVARKGYSLEGWYIDGGSERFTGSTPVTRDMTVVARWTEPGSQPTTPPAPVGPSGPSVIVPVTPSTPAPQPSEPGEEIEDPDVPLASLPYVDVDHEKWYAQSVANVVAKGLMEGTDGLLFAPKDAMTRGTMAQALYALAKKPEAGDPTRFLDLADGVSYADAVAWGVSQGLIMGYSETEFGGEDAINRQQMATLLYRYAKEIDKRDVSAKAGVLEQFSDRGRVSSWAEQAMAWAVTNKLILGRTDGTLDPRAEITRAEAAAILDRYYKQFLA